MWYLSFSSWLPSLSIIISSCIHVAADGIISFFLWLSGIQLYVCDTSSLSVHLWMDVQVVSMSHLLWTVLLWTQGCRYLFQLAFCLDTCPGVELLYYMVALFLVFWGTSMLFSIVAAPIYISMNSVWGSPFLHIFANFVFFLRITILVSVWWCLMVLLICFSLMISDAEYFIMCPLTICISALRNCCSVLWPIFQFDVESYELGVYVVY